MLIEQMKATFAEVSFVYKTENVAAKSLAQRAQDQITIEAEFSSLTAADRTSESIKRTSEVKK